MPTLRTSPRSRPADAPAFIARIGLEPLLFAPAVHRLCGISFLGALHPTALRATNSRLDHSVGVAMLIAEVMSRMLVPATVLRHGIAAGLLHDACQWPLSHTAERVFRDLTRYGNGQLISAMLTDSDELPVSHHLGPVLRTCGLDRDLLIWGLLRGYRQAPMDAGWTSLVDLLSGPINPDTLDGIARSAALKGETCPDVRNIVGRFVASGDRLCIHARDLSLLDDFWTAKARVYERHIHSADAIRTELAVAARVRAAYAAGLKVGPALDLDDEDVIGEIRDLGPPRAGENLTTGNRYRKVRRYVICDAPLPLGDLIPLPDLADRYLSIVDE